MKYDELFVNRLRMSFSCQDKKVARGSMLYTL
jgi:hypothetical protein